MTTNSTTTENSNLKTYCSFKPSTMEEKKKLYNTLNKCDVVLNDVEGSEINLKDVFISEYIRKDKTTGEQLKGLGHRIVLFDTDGKSYITLSNYFFNSLLKLFATFGYPETWTEPLQIKIIKIKTKNGGQALSFDLV